ncbi:hypothetical protein E2C01_057603 [Portunus trituberculatus]|uniref:Uncharacterized protein n=1 Tax=Portunus trituberculatus TaxID=210409 RepID=A0A5B7H1K2_PORTR|nr:hypothetical protein [Portunus trituberculatus]
MTRLSQKQRKQRLNTHIFQASQRSRDLNDSLSSCCIINLSFLTQQEVRRKRVSECAPECGMSPSQRLGAAWREEVPVEFN